jgi:HAL2 family 3'(2'),5'-bisphosphate nucleotidase
MRHLTRRSASNASCDPIDGTIGYVNRRQYCVALALLHRGEPVLGVLGCPSLGPSTDVAVEDCGTIFHAVKGGGTYSVGEREAARGQLGRRVQVDSLADPAGAVFCESVEAKHSSHELSARVAGILGVKAIPARMDSQAKYGAMARGDFHIFLRFPRGTYVENVWDHAPAACIIQEAGGRVTDGRGRPLDFSKGRCLDNDDGIVATNGLLHDAVIDAVQQALREKRASNSAPE